jgi:hypothetical protein
LNFLAKPQYSNAREQYTQINKLSGNPGMGMMAFPTSYQQLLDLENGSVGGKQGEHLLGGAVDGQDGAILVGPVVIMLVIIANAPS